MANGEYFRGLGAIKVSGDLVDTAYENFLAALERAKDNYVKSLDPNAFKNEMEAIVEPLKEKYLFLKKRGPNP